MDWKNTGIDLFHEKEYRNSVRFLELAEKILNLGSHVLLIWRLSARKYFVKQQQPFVHYQLIISKYKFFTACYNNRSIFNFKPEEKITWKPLNKTFAVKNKLQFGFLLKNFLLH